MKQFFSPSGHPPSPAAATRLVWGALLLGLGTYPLPARPRDEQWKQVQEAVRQGLPKTAIKRLQPIITEAMADKAYAEAVKAIGQEIALEGMVDGDKPDEKIVRMQDAIKKAPAAMKPAMEALLAHWYWQYFRENRWNYLQRTQAVETPGADFKTWDLPRILAEIGTHFDAALSKSGVLQSTPIATFDALLEKGSVPDRYRPTLYDFFAYEALSFYQTGEQASTLAEDAFEIEDSSPIFDDADTFLKWKPATTDTASPRFKAIRLYQELLRFHEHDKDRSAFHDADLARLAYGLNCAIGEFKDERYETALEHFITGSSGHEISARALAQLGNRRNLAGEPALALKLARRGLDAFPKSAGAKECFNLIQQLEARSIQLSTEQVWNAPWPTLDVTYRNLGKVYFRAVPVSFDDYVTGSRWSYGSMDHDSIPRLMALKPSLAWEAPLPPTTDLKPRTEKVPAPSGLKHGFYAIFASCDPGFQQINNQISVSTVWVSDLALVLQRRDDGNNPSGLVMQADSGEPVAGAKVRVWQDQQNQFKPVSALTTDENGRFEFPADHRALVLLAEHQGQAVSSMHAFQVYGHSYPKPNDTHTVFFMDRALYRPGQTIQYKGLSIRGDQSTQAYAAAAGQTFTVVLGDPNGKEIARTTHTANDFGSFSGVFTAPRDRMTGLMSIRVLEGQGNTSFRVEEYKRPKFQVELPLPSKAPRLEAPVVLTGKATAYTGAPIDGAKVKWRVERAVQCPSWCWWWRPAQTKAIAHGTATTGLDGTFKIEFPADPDRSVPQRNEPVFFYMLHADVTDTTGETRSSDQTVRVGYTALQAEVGVGEWQTPDKPVVFSVSTLSLDGLAQAASGTIAIHELRQPATVERAPLRRDSFAWHGEESKADPANPDSWELGPMAAQQTFRTDASGRTILTVPLKAGIYRLSLETQDRFGRPVTARRTVQVVDPLGSRYGIKLPNYFGAPAWMTTPGRTFAALWGTGYDQGRAFVEIECGGQPLKRYWTQGDRTQERLELPVTETMRGGFTVRVTSIRENRAYINERIVAVPWTNKQLAVKWESFRSRLLPGQKETWTAAVSGAGVEAPAVEMVATLYDASLDQYSPHDWPSINVFRREFRRCHTQFQNTQIPFTFAGGGWNVPRRKLDWSYRSFPFELRTGHVTLGLSTGMAVSGSAAPAVSRVVDLCEEREGDLTVAYAGARMAKASAMGNRDEEAEPPPQPDLSRVVARRNLSEIAFFFPHLTSDDKGVVRMSFTMPDALTQWKFLGFAHDAQLRSGSLTDKVVTAKDLMVEPNPPRFLREGDAIEFTVKISNQSEQSQQGAVKLSFADAATLQSADAALGHRAPEQTFEIPAKQSRTFAWRIAVPDGLDFLIYKAVAATSQASDGEEGYLPVLSRRSLVTESLPLPIRGKTTKSFAFQKLLESAGSDTLRHRSLTVQMTSQPAWYAVMALPYLMEFPYECSEQVFNRLYANALARHIATSDPKIRRVFDLWKNSPALESPLEKNLDLKSVALEEMPWVRQAKSEGEARRNVGLLFDANRLEDETTRSLRKLSEQQLGDGRWPWFPGGRPSEYISLYILTGFGRLRHLGVALDMSTPVKALNLLDAWMDDHYHRILASPSPETYIPGSTDALYLYGRSFYLQDHPIAQKHRKAIDFFLKHARSFWLKSGGRQTQAHLALALQRFGDKVTPKAILRSLKERSVSTDELGMFWRDQETSWWWYHAPIETQALMIEAFAEVARDDQAVEDCQVWLLKQKQTQNWSNTKATADAIYGLLLRGKDLLASDALVEVALGGETLHPEKTEAGTGFYELRFTPEAIQPALGEITVRKTGEGVSWGSVHWQYLEDIARLTPHDGTPLKLKKTLYLKQTSQKGQELVPVAGPVAVGDELVVRLELRSDRDMEFVHLKDQRGSGTEPLNVLSRYTYKDGLAYYESTRDTASHFFIDYLPKGTYVFEYSTRVQLKGTYQTGIAEIQCMYAPEFNSHSGSLPLEVR